MVCTQSIDHFITYSVIASEPALSYTSVVSTIRCFAVTSGEKEGSTFVQWTGHFSTDADAGESSSRSILLGRLMGRTKSGLGVIEDARFKRKEALADLAAAASKK